MGDPDHDDELIRMAAIAMDPLYGKPVPPTQTTAAHLIQLATQQYNDSAPSGRRRLSAPLVVAVSAALVMLAAGFYLSGTRQPAPLQPGPVEPCPSVAPPVPPVAAATRPARAELSAIAVQARRSVDTPSTGRFTYVRTRSWSWDPTTDGAQGSWADHELWWAPDGSGAAETSCGGERTSIGYQPGGIRVPIEAPSADPPVLASQLAAIEDFRSGPAAPLRAVVDMYRYHVLDAAHRAATIRVLASTDGLVFHGSVTDGLGRGGVAISIDSDDGTRDVAIFDPNSGHLLSYERAAVLSPARSGVRAPAVIASVLFLASGRTDVAGEPATS